MESTCHCYEKYVYRLPSITTNNRRLSRTHCLFIWLLSAVEVIYSLEQKLLLMTHDRPIRKRNAAKNFEYPEIQVFDTCTSYEAHGIMHISWDRKHNRKLCLLDIHCHLTNICLCNAKSPIPGAFWQVPSQIQILYYHM